MLKISNNLPLPPVLLTDYNSFLRVIKGGSFLDDHDFNIFRKLIGLKQNVCIFMRSELQLVN